MLRYSQEYIRRMLAPGNDRNVTPAPFPGRYPTRIHAYRQDNSWSYFGKPTPAAWRAILRHTGDAMLGPRYVEFDRKQIVRMRLGFNLVRCASLLRRYYIAAYDDFTLLSAWKTYTTFRPMVLREGSVYASPVIMSLYPEWTLDMWRANARARIRQQPCDLPQRINEEGLPEPAVAVKHELGEAERIFYEVLLGHRPGTQPPTPGYNPPRLRRQQTQPGPIDPMEVPVIPNWRAEEPPVEWRVNVAERA